MIHGMVLLVRRLNVVFLPLFQSHRLAPLLRIGIPLAVPRQVHPPVLRPIPHTRNLLLVELPVIGRQVKNARLIGRNPESIITRHRRLDRPAQTAQIIFPHIPGGPPVLQQLPVRCGRQHIHGLQRVIHTPPRHIPVHVLRQIARHAAGHQRICVKKKLRKVRSQVIVRVPVLGTVLFRQPILPHHETLFRLPVIRNGIAIHIIRLGGDRL